LSASGCEGAMLRRTLVVVLGAGLWVVPVAWLAVGMIADRRFQAEMHRAEAEFAARRYDAAGARLARLARRRPGRGDVEYWLGMCENLAGHPDAALAAWGRVPDGASEAPQAARRRAELALERGRLAVAEESLERASRLPGGSGDEVRDLLIRVYWRSGRSEDARRLLRVKCSRSSAP